MFVYGDNDHYTRFHDQRNPFPFSTSGSETSSPSGSSSDEHLIQSGYVLPPTITNDAKPFKENVLAEEIRMLLQSAINCTEQLSMMFDGIKCLRRDAWKEVSQLCWSIGHCLRAPPEIRHSYQPPKGSTWCMRRAILLGSLKSNLQKYIRLSDVLASKPIRLDKFRPQLEKLSAYEEKFSYLFSRIKASSEKMRLMQLRDAYEQLRRQLQMQVEEERRRRHEAQRAYYSLKASHYEALRNMQRRCHCSRNGT